MQHLKPPLPDINIVRFRPPLIEETENGIKLSLPHIRLDRALDYLLGDRLA
jgi:predicted YcjX-like family ATPase